ncbi:hypothetical protein FH968_00085 [Buttiauxella sp. B2]|uniref:hypothetical protein n=1 Tax=Buttiauxella sp. B2 TaxID=2587812 RepID=UPI001120AF00|nr:hypothetical protein [Buttiauxella sp. B2]TNV22499.1 hypothetical protein FH968_00085 [Buttiauxella sp. B2]
MAKTELQLLNRAFRKAMKSWLGKPGGFKSKREWRSWCRENACALESIRSIEGIAPHEEIHDQYDADSVVIEEMSNW